METAYADIWPDMDQPCDMDLWVMKWRSAWPIFDGPVILPYILNTIWCMHIILWAMNQYDPTFDLKINVGQCDLYFMVQWFCLTSWRLFDVWTSLFGIMNQYDLMFDRKIKCSSLWLLRIKVRLPVLLCAVKTVDGDFRFCWMISPKVGQTHKENPNLVRIFIWHLHWMIYIQTVQQITRKLI